MRRMRIWWVRDYGHPAPALVAGGLPSIATANGPGLIESVEFYAVRSSERNGSNMMQQNHEQGPQLG